MPETWFEAYRDTNPNTIGTALFLYGSITPSAAAAAAANFPTLPNNNDPLTTVLTLTKAIETTLLPSRTKLTALMKDILNLELQAARSVADKPSTKVAKEHYYAACEAYTSMEERFFKDAHLTGSPREATSSEVTRNCARMVEFVGMHPGFLERICERVCEAVSCAEEYREGLCDVSVEEEEGEEERGLKIGMGVEIQEACDKRKTSGGGGGGVRGWFQRVVVGHWRGYEYVRRRNGEETVGLLGCKDEDES